MHSWYQVASSVGLCVVLTRLGADVLEATRVSDRLQTHEPPLENIDSMSADTLSHLCAYLLHRVEEYDKLLIVDILCKPVSKLHHRHHCLLHFRLLLTVPRPSLSEVFEVLQHSMGPLCLRQRVNRTLF